MKTRLVSDLLTKLNKQNKCKVVLENLQTAPVKPAAIKQSALACQGTLGQVQVNMQKFNENDILTSLIPETQKIKRSFMDNGIKRIHIGKPIQGYGDLLETVSHATFHYDKNNKLKRIFIRNAETSETHIYNGLGKLEKHYDANEIAALKYYKYHPDDIHILLRENRDIYSGNRKTKTHECINKLDEIFRTNTFKSEQPMILYRGMDKNLNCNTGDIYKADSFVSTSTNLDTAKRFAGKNQIMEITFPKNSEYIDMDALFNIDRNHWQEQEYLLNRNSKFKITGYDKNNNIVKAEYIP